MQPEERGRFDSVQAVFDDDSIFVKQWHHIGDGPQSCVRKQVDEQSLDRLADAFGFCSECRDAPREFVCDAGATQIGEGIRRIGSPRMRNCERVGQIIDRSWRTVMIGDDEINAQLSRDHRRFDRCDATIDGDDQRDSLCCELSDAFTADSVAVVDSVGDMNAQLCLRRDCAGDMVDDRSTGHAIHVVVPPDHNLFPIAERLEQAVRCDIEIGDRRGVVQVGQPRLAKVRHTLGGGEPSTSEDGSWKGAERQAGRRLNSRLDRPASGKSPHGADYTPRMTSSSIEPMNTRNGDGQ